MGEMHTPTVSVIVPNYNHAKFLRQRIDSIFAQTYRDFELILMDDGSTDGSRAILSEYASAPSAGAESPGRINVRLDFNETNSGSPFKQWNKGVRLAQGKYVWMAESDDYADPRLLERLVAVLDADPEVVFAFCRSWCVMGDERLKGFADETLPDPGRWAADFYMDGTEMCRRYFALVTPIANASSAVFRKSAYEKIGGADESLRLCGDWKVWAGMALEGKVAYVSEPLNYFRFHAESARGRTGLAGTDAVEYIHVSRWVLDRVRVPDSAFEQICQARAGGWVPVMLSLRIPLAVKRRTLRAARALDPHPFRRLLRPALTVARLKLQRHWREFRSAFGRS